MTRGTGHVLCLQQTFVWEKLSTVFTRTGVRRYG
jgi:hypothetical protein